MHTVQTPDARDLARRLATRLEEKGWTYKEFQQRVREASDGARGTSYGSVWSYVNGEVAEPRPRVLRAMADVLGLSVDWLVSGAGPRTRGEAARRALGPSPSDDEGHGHLGTLVRAMEMARSRLPAPEREVLARRDHVVENLVADLLESGGRGLETYGEGEVAEAFVLVAWLLSLPARVMGVDERGPRPGGGEEYVLAMATALRIAMPPSPDGHPYNVLSRLRRVRAALGTGSVPSGLHPPASPSRGVGPTPH